MKKKSILLMIAAVAMAVVSWILLPAQVVVQVGLDGQPSTTLPKILAVGIPFAIAIIGALMYMGEKSDVKPRGLIISIVGIAAMGLSLLFNR